MQKITKIKIFFGFFVTCVVVGIAIGSFVYNKPHINVAKSKSDKYVSAKTLLADFEANELKANTEYLEQIVEVTGVISELSIHKNKGIISLESQEAMGSVLCHLSMDETAKMTTLKQGTTITIKGICTGYLMDVILIKSVIKN